MKITHIKSDRSDGSDGFEETFSAAVTAVLRDGLNDIARQQGLIQRQSKISGQSLVQGLVFGFLAHPQATEVQLAQSVSRAGVPVTPQAVNARLTKQAAEVFKTVLERLTHRMLELQPLSRAQTHTQTQSLLDRFSEVNVHDSTTINLPNACPTRCATCGLGVATAPITVKQPSSCKCNGTCAQAHSSC